MNKLIIYEYIDKINKKDIINFCINQGIFLEDYEVDVIYYYIKNEYKRFFSNPELILDEIKFKVKNITYLKLEELYNKYKKKIS